MAVIGKIQSNKYLLLGAVGLAMLAFIFTEYIKGGGSDYEQLPTGTVYGETIDEEEYKELAETFVNREKQNAAMQGREVTDQDVQNGEDQAFNEVVRRNLMNREFDALGLTCTSAELNDMIHGNHIHPWVMQIPIFISATGEFSRDSVRNFINNLEVEPESEEAREQWLVARAQWKAFEQELKDTRTADKYVTLIKKGLYVNSLEAEHQYYANYEKKRIQFVIQRYSDIPFDEIEVTDEDIKAYYDEHKHEKKYEQEEARDIDHIVFAVNPTKEDEETLLAKMTDLKASFKTSTFNIGFMQANSEMAQPFLSDSATFRMGTSKLQIDAFFGNHQYPEVADEAIQAADSGDVVGPFVSIDPATNQREMFIAKVTGIKRERQAWVRHILVKVDNTRSDEAAKAKVDSIINVIKANDNFVEMVQKTSDDPGSIASNGEYKWFAEGRMVPEFNDASFNGEIGKLQVVKTTYGYHIVEVLGRADRVVPKLAVVVKPLKPGENTLKQVEERVFDFIYNVKNSDRDSAFQKIAQDSGLVVQSARVWMNNSYVVGFDKPEKLLKFAFNRKTEEGAISDPILDGNTYKVAIVMNKIEEGAPEFEDVKEQMRFPALRDKQAAVYMEKMGGKKSLTDVATVLTNGQIVTAEVSFGNNVITGGGGMEPEVIGKLFTNIPVGSMTVPIKGRTGVYVCIVEAEIPAPETTDFSLEQGNMLAARAGSADNLVIRALREKADVQDNRRKIELY